MYRVHYQKSLDYLGKLGKWNELKRGWSFPIKQKEYIRELILNIDKVSILVNQSSSLVGRCIIDVSRSLGLPENEVVETLLAFYRLVQVKPLGIEDLPYEINSIILQNLDAKSISYYSQASKFLSAANADNVLWKNLLKRDYDTSTDIDPKTAYKAMSRFKKIRSNWITKIELNIRSDGNLKKGASLEDFARPIAALYRLYPGGGIFFIQKFFKKYNDLVLKSIHMFNIFAFSIFEAMAPFPSDIEKIKEYVSVFSFEYQYFDPLFARGDPSLQVLFLMTGISKTWKKLLRSPIARPILTWMIELFESKKGDPFMEKMKKNFREKLKETIVIIEKDYKRRDLREEYKDIYWFLKQFIVSFKWKKKLRDSIRGNVLSLVCGVEKRKPFLLEHWKNSTIAGELLMNVFSKDLAQACIQKKRNSCQKDPFKT